jgi:hypothetical protein
LRVQSSFIRCDITIICGLRDIVDLRGCGLPLISQVNPLVMKKFSSLIQHFPLRIKAIHNFHPPKPVLAVFNMYSHFFHDKIGNRVYMHENFDDLYKVVDKKFLPAEYRGTNSNLPEIIKNWSELIVNNR